MHGHTWKAMHARPHRFQVRLKEWTACRSSCTTTCSSFDAVSTAPVARSNACVFVHDVRRIARKQNMHAQSEPMHVTARTRQAEEHGQVAVQGVGHTAQQAVQPVAGGVHKGHELIGKGQALLRLLAPAVAPVVVAGQGGLVVGGLGGGDEGLDDGRRVGEAVGGRPVMRGCGGLVSSGGGRHV